MFDCTQEGISMNTTYSTYFQTARAVAAYQERSYRNHLRRTRQLTKRIFFSLAATLIAVFIGILTTGFLSRAQASSEPVHYKYFRSIMVYSGDTLSAISSRYMDNIHPSRIISTRSAKWITYRMQTISTPEIIWSFHTTARIFTERFRHIFRKSFCWYLLLGHIFSKL